MEGSVGLVRKGPGSNPQHCPYRSVTWDRTEAAILLGSVLIWCASVPLTLRWRAFLSSAIPFDNKVLKRNISKVFYILSHGTFSF